MYIDIANLEHYTQHPEHAIHIYDSASQESVISRKGA